MISSLRVRMLLAVGLLAIGAVLAVALAARQGTRRGFRRFQELEKISTELQPQLQPGRIATQLDGHCCSPEELRVVTPGLSPHLGILILDEKGTLVAKAGHPVESLSDVRVLRSGEVLSVEASQHDHDAAVSTIGLRFRVPATPIRLSDGRAAAVYVLPFPDPASERPEAVFLGSVDRSLLWATILVALIALLVTWTLTSRIVGPIEELRVATRELARGNLARRVPARGSDEVAELARGFNAMAGELEQQQTLRRNLVHDVVHELRTPLTSLRCRLDAVADSVSRDPAMEMEGANEELDHLARMVDDLHELALAEARELRLTIGSVAVRPLVESGARAAGLEGDRRLHMELADGLILRADAVRMRQVVMNVLSNAARYTPADGMITVRSRREADAAILEVHNTGSSLSPDELARVFDRFYRADPSRQRATGGTGLGLAIVKNLVEAQGGRVSARSDAAGVIFTISLPLA